MRGGMGCVGHSAGDRCPAVAKDREGREQEHAVATAGASPVARTLPRRRRPTIAIFDYEVTETSPAGSCHLRLLEGLQDEYDFTVFASRFTNPAPERIRWVRVPAITRPLAARYLTYYATSRIARRWHGRKVVTGGDARGFDLIQTVEGYTPDCDVSYVHFCHTAFLRRTDSEHADWGIRSTVRRLDHVLRARREHADLSSARRLVVPAPHLADELCAELHLAPERIGVVPNPVDLASFRPPADFPRTAIRTRLGASADELLVAFVALGHFERKG